MYAKAGGLASIVSHIVEWWMKIIGCEVDPMISQSIFHQLHSLCEFILHVLRLNSTLEAQMNVITRNRNQARKRKESRLRPIARMRINSIVMRKSFPMTFICFAGNFILHYCSKLSALLVSGVSQVGNLQFVLDYWRFVIRFQIATVVIVDDIRRSGSDHSNC